jgi:hypothetical protein
MPEVIIETFRNPGEPSSQPVRVRPVPGQFDEDFRVWCSTSKRETVNAGSRFRVQASWVVGAGRETYLRVGLDQEWEPMTEIQVREYLMRLGARRLRPPKG